MAFTQFEYLSAVRDFILTYPYGSPYDVILIDHQEIVANQLSDRWGAGAALLLTGDSILSRRRTVTGREILNKRINFSLVMWRYTNDDEFRRDIANFINQLVNWVNNENMLRGTPLENPQLPNFGTTGREIISADGGIRTAQIEGGRSEFSIQIHIDYTLML